MNISIKDLKKCSDIIFQLLEEKGIEECNLDYDMYWYIPQEMCYNPYVMPDIKNLTIGQLSFDMEILQSLIRDPKCSVAYSLVCLSTILRAIADQMSAMNSSNKGTKKIHAKKRYKAAA